MNIFEGNGIKKASQYPLELQGVRSLQVSSEYNKELMKIENNQKEYKLMIKQNWRSEKLILKSVNKKNNF
ncbi:hypothetical protein [Saccharibacillus kuerlensis]|uniref:Uncharacterized protein n=1 Tax=Saccharibacillus kuerlensis TaxID=459527 RepID=A0ABQ2L337_9BACL|nr:hypothetical protein [Saccharibacillus kuerlensis]GGO00943.1 hypothetical protein GCM10010969_22690 [Saccharibacillus kuerlensis]